MDAHHGQAAGELSSTTATEAPSYTVLLGGRSDSAEALPESLSREGYSVLRVHDGRAAVEHLRQRPVDVLILDHLLPGLDGTEVCQVVKRDPRTRLLPIIVLLRNGAAHERLSAIEAGADDVLSPPVDVDEVMARVRALARLKRYTDDFEVAASVMTTLATMIEARNRYSEGHCHRMANYAAALGRRLGLNGDDIHVLRRGGFLHDIGMLAIPDAVLLKPASLDDRERALIRSHPIIGESLIANLRSLQPVRAIVRHHHERLDGSGYPDGLSGDEIPLAAQIVGLVEVFEALTSSRPYQKTLSTREALAVLEQQATGGSYRQDLFEELGRVVNVAGGACLE